MGDSVSVEATPGLSTRERNRAHIIAAARDLWMCDASAPMDDVARAAGVVRRTLYGHFATRDDLIIAVAADAAAFVAHIAAEHESATGAAARLARVTMQLLSYGPQLRLLLDAASHVHDAAIARLAATIDETITGVVADGQRTGEFADHLPPEVMARVLKSAAMALRDAAAEDMWSGGVSQAAVAGLVLVGVDRVVASEVVCAVASNESMAESTPQ